MGGGGIHPGEGGQRLGLGRVVGYGGAWEVDLTRLADALARGAKGKEDSRYLLVF